MQNNIKKSGFYLKTGYEKLNVWVKWANFTVHSYGRMSPGSCSTLSLGLDPAPGEWIAY